MYKPQSRGIEKGSSEGVGIGSKIVLDIEKREKVFTDNW